MTAPEAFERPEAVEALVLDRYLDALLAAADRRALDVPAEVSLDPDVRAAARRLSRELVRVHPSFRFEERLAARLAAAAAGMARDGIALAPEPASGALPTQLPTPRPVAGRSTLGGAVASAVLSLAGAAFVAWRRSQAQTRRSAPASSAAEVHA